MDLFSYDHEELARQIQTELDRMTVNFLRSHGALVRRDDLDFHGFEHIDLEVTFDDHHLVVRQTRRAQGAPAPADDAVSTFESTFDGRPATEVSTGLIAQWLALLPTGERKEERVKSEVDPANPFLADIQEQQESEPVNPFLTGHQAARERNPFAPDDADKKRRAAFEWLAGDDDTR